jgi:hypothetical protein
MPTVDLFVAYQFSTTVISREEREAAINTAIEAVRRDLAARHPTFKIDWKLWDLHSADNVFVQIKQMIDRSGVFVADISELNPNVLFELGYAFGLREQRGNKIVIMCHDGVDVRQLPSDLLGMFVVKYAPEQFQSVFQREIKRAIQGYITTQLDAQLNHFSVRDFWRFDDNTDIDIVCSELPDDHLPYYAKPSDRNYLRYARFADLDSFVHVKSNLLRLFPNMRIRDFTASEHKSSDYNGTMVLGGPAWNQRFMAYQDLIPVRFEDREQEENDVLVVDIGEDAKPEFRPKLNKNRKVVGDISVAIRTSDAAGRTTFLFAGSLTFGVLGASRAFLSKICGIVNCNFVTDCVGDDDIIMVFESEYLEHEVLVPRFDVKKPLYFFHRTRGQGGQWRLKK